MTGSADWPDAVRRVVVVAPRVPEASGGAVVVGSYVRMFEAAGLEVRVVSLYPGTGDPGFRPTVVLRRESWQRWPVVGDRRGWRRAVRLPLVAVKRVDRLLALRRYRRLMAACGADTLVVFTHVMPMTVLREAGLAWGASRPVVVGQHHSAFASLEDHPGLRDRIREDLADVDRFTALSEADARAFGRLLPVPCVALPNPTSLVAADDERDEARPAPPVVVALARYSPEKQLDLLVRAFVAATDADGLRHWRLHLYGWGPEEERIRDAIRACDAGSRVRLMGVVDDVRPVLRNAACTVLASRSEGFGMSVLEAAQCGVPSVAFDCSPGLSALLEQVHGVGVTPVSDERALAAALRRALADPAALARRGALAREGARAYRPEAVLRSWAALVRSVLGERSTTGRPGGGAPVSGP